MILAGAGGGHFMHGCVRAYYACSRSGVTVFRKFALHSMLWMSPVHPLKGACPLSIQLSSEYIVLSTAFVEVHTIFRA